MEVKEKSKRRYVEILRAGKRRASLIANIEKRPIERGTESRENVDNSRSLVMAATMGSLSGEEEKTEGKGVFLGGQPRRRRARWCAVTLLKEDWK